MKRNVGLLVCGLALCFVHAALSQEERIRVHCPAVRQDDYNDRGADVPTNIQPVAMIVVGSLNPETMTLDVDRSLLGPKVTRIKLVDEPRQKLPKDQTPQIYCLSLARHEWQRDPKRPGVLTLVPAAEVKFTISRYFEHYRVFPLKDESALTAMTRARLDLLVLGSPTILVGRPLAVDADKQANADPFSEREPKRVTIQVERVLHGDSSLVGKKLLTSGGDDPLPSVSGSYIYFVQDSTEEKPLAVLPIRRRWPDSEIPLVEATLKRRTLFPVKNGQQEIMFSGTVREAITLMGNHFDAAQTLAARRLITDRQAALPEVVAFIEPHLFRSEWPADGPVTESHLSNLIRALGIMEDHRTDGEVVRLIRLMLDKIQAGTPLPRRVDPDKRPPRRSSRYLDTDANHSLVWLSQTLDESDVARLFGKRLLELRSVGKYGWFEEIQEVLDRGHLEDQMELAAVRLRMETIQPLRWSAASEKDATSPQGHLEPIDQIEFADGGQRLKTSSPDGVVCLWDPKTGAAKGRNKTEPPTKSDRKPNRERISGRKLDYNETEFLSEDHQRWYLFKVTETGGKYGPPEAFSVQVGDAAQQGSTNKDGAELLPVVGDWRSLGEVNLKWGQHRPFGLAPDGQHLHFATQIYRREDLKFVSAANVTGKLDEFRFVAGGSRYLLKTSDQAAPRSGPLPGVTIRDSVVIRIRVHDTKTGRTLLAVEVPPKPKSRFETSPDGKLLAIVGNENNIQVWSIPNE